MTAKLTDIPRDVSGRLQSSGTVMVPQRTLSPTSNGQSPHSRFFASGTEVSAAEQISVIHTNRPIAVATRAPVILRYIVSSVDQ